MPATNKQVRDAACVTHKLLAFADRQFVHRVDHECVIAVEVVRTPSIRLINGEIAGIIEIGFGVGIVRQELQTAADALLYLHLQSVVFVVCIVAKVV